MSAVQTSPRVAAAKARAAEAKAAETRVAPRKPIEPIAPNSLKHREYCQADRVGVAYRDSEPQDYDDNPSLWLHLVGAVHQFDKVALIGANGDWWAEYLVVSSVSGHMNARLISAIRFPVVDPMAELEIREGYEYRRGVNPEQEPHGIYRISDGWLMNGDQFHKSRREAVEWFNKHPIFADQSTAKAWHEG